MRHPTRPRIVSAPLVLAALAALTGACSSSLPNTTAGTGGSPGTGGMTTGTGGMAPGTGGTATGGTSAGGSPGTGGGTGGEIASTGGVAGTAGAGGGGGGPAGAGGGAAGSPGTGGSGGASASGCAGKAYKLCEDFESSTAGSIPTGWTTFKGYNGKIGATDEAV
ncbi:MAG: hypothetical protein ABUS79_31015, partial [Pseudomonadota bacterium]